MTRKELIEVVARKTDKPGTVCEEIIKTTSDLMCLPSPSKWRVLRMETLITTMYPQFIENKALYWVELEMEAVIGKNKI